MPTQIGFPPPAPELVDLLAQVSDHPIDLFDHRLGEDLYLCADFNGCNLSAGYPEPLVGYRVGAWHALAEGSIPAPSLDALPDVLNVQNVLCRVDALLQLGRLTDVVEVLD